MTEHTIQEYAQTKGFHPQVLQRWLNWNPHDGAALLDIALSLKAGENHLRDLMDWLEEIALRDGVVICEILANKAISEIRTDPRLGRADRLKRIKDQVRRMRFPRLSQIEDSIRSKSVLLRLAAVAESDTLAELYLLLNGTATAEGRAASKSL